ncbi:family 20 glycosylhydrolase [Pseudoalteromonas sp. H105]|uniref:family 20 glycosylhydrolase n=1 Tax=Pseudoalteromonas sp. H105 TaxID=1348393 RepID=UPI00073222E8|nr:family 20 glycosylhydrolase [Pseudoalteromonas sp. H105]KTF16807.1 beta-N-acetylhexosaminidase [Pseudoalteromonas sp. H105]
MRCSKFIFILFSLLFSSLAFSSVHPRSELPLMPMPKHIIQHGAELSLGSTLSVYIEGMSQQREEFQLQRLQLHLSRINQSSIKILQGSKELADIKINIHQPELALLVPQFGEDESYTLLINNSDVNIQAMTVFGAQHALTTLIQLANTGEARREKKGISFPTLSIDDDPRFAWRGLLIDSARHFLSLQTMKRQLDGMAAAKLNVFHWHLTDDQGWRVESKKYPRLTATASDGNYYSQQEIKEVVQYASLLGIRVLPEIGMPGHASAIAVAYPKLMTKNKLYEMERHWGVFKPLLDIANPEVYEFIDTLVGEMVTLFPERYFHIGGDEVDPAHWLEDVKIKNLMQQSMLQSGADLQSYFNSKVQPIIAKHQRVMVGWDEIFHPNLSNNIVVQSWRGHDSLNAVAKAGYQGLLSTGFYIDQPQYTDYHYRNDPLLLSPRIDLTQPKRIAKQFVIERLKGKAIQGELLLLGSQLLIKLNNNHHQLAVKTTQLSPTQHLSAQLDSWMGPLTFEFNFIKNTGFVLIGNSRYPITTKDVLLPAPVTITEPLSKTQETSILGAEATIWSEMVTEDNIDLRIWPRLFAISERLWSQVQVNNPESMYERLERINGFTHKVINLAHAKQQQSGFKALIDSKLTKHKQRKTLNLLNTMSQLLEPSHYYTRHHIKFLNDKYHQNASLDSYVDFLAVESKQIRYLKQQVNAFKAGNKKAAENIYKQLLSWEQALALEHGLLSKSKRLKPLQPVFDKLTLFLTHFKIVLEVCKSSKADKNIGDELLSLQSLTDELVLAGIYPVRDLYLHCVSSQDKE